MREGKASLSLAEYTLAARVREPSAEDLKNVALDYVLLKSYPDAATWIDRAAELKTDDPDIWYVKGRIDYERLRYQRAAECFERALNLAPHDPKIENNLGLAYEALNRPADAINAYEDAIQAMQGSELRSEQPYINLAILRAHRGETRDAEALLAKALQIAPSDLRAHRELGRIYEAAGRLTEAQGELETAVKLSPEDAGLHFLLGRVYRRNHQEAKAAAEFNRCAELTNAQHGMSAKPPTLP